MHTEIVTTITTKIDMDTLEPTTTVKVKCKDPIPHDVIYTTVAETCRAMAMQAEKKLSDNKTPRSLSEDPEPGTDW